MKKMQVTENQYLSEMVVEYIPDINNQAELWFGVGHIGKPLRFAISQADARAFHAWLGAVLTMRLGRDDGPVSSIEINSVILEKQQPDEAITA